MDGWGHYAFARPSCIASGVGNAQGTVRGGGHDGVVVRGALNTARKSDSHHGATVFGVNDFFFAVWFFVMILLSVIRACRATPRQLMVTRAERPVQGRAALSRGRLRRSLSRPLRPRPEVWRPGRGNGAATEPGNARLFQFRDQTRDAAASSFHGWPVRSIALAITNSRRMVAISATDFSLPASTRRR